MLSNNTRMYHRSSVLAFPKTTDYACSLEVPCKKYSFASDTVKLLSIVLIASISAALIITSGIVQ